MNIYKKNYIKIYLYIFLLNTQKFCPNLLPNKLKNDFNIICIKVDLCHQVAHPFWEGQRHRHRSAKAEEWPLSWHQSLCEDIYWDKFLVCIEGWKSILIFMILFLLFLYSITSHIMSIYFHHKSLFFKKNYWFFLFLFLRAKSWGYCKIIQNFLWIFIFFSLYR